MTNSHFKAAGAAFAALAFALMTGLCAPVAAQQTETPTPAPSTGPAPGPVIDLRLPVPTRDGRTPGVQGPSNNGLPPVAPGDRPAPSITTPSPAPTAPPPRVTPTQPGPTTEAAPPRRTPPVAAPAPSRAAPAREPAQDATANPAPSTDVLAPSAAPATAPTDGETPEAAVDAAPAAATAPPSDDGGTPLWAWLLTLLAAAGAGYWYWRRRPVPTESGESAAIEAPVAARAAPSPAAPKPAAPKAAALPLVMRPAAEHRAMVALALDIRAIRMTPEHVAINFALDATNQGSAAATGMMVRIALNQGSAMPEPVLARFFDGAGGSVLRDDMELAPGAGEIISGEVMMPRVGIDPLMIGGKPLLVPVLAFDVTYHWDGDGDAFGQAAGSYVLGRDRGGSGSDKLAPLPLDRQTYAVDKPGARATAVRRTV